MASIERILKYYGIQHIDADRLAVNIADIGGGASPERVLDALSELVRTIDLKAELITSYTSDALRAIKKSIDNGHPVIFSDHWHCQLIVGYNEKTKEIAISDSDGNELKRYKEQDDKGDIEKTGHRWLTADKFEKRFSRLIALSD